MIAPLRMALQALAANKLRSSLTMLGNIIGVTCVVTLINLGNCFREKMVSNLSSIGQNLLFVHPLWDRDESNPSKRYHPLDMTDVEAIQRGCPSVGELTPEIGTSSKVAFLNKNKTASIEGAWPSFLTLSDMKLARGTNFTHADVGAAAKVCVIGATMATELFGNLEPLGQTLRIDRQPFVVVGVLEKKGSSLMGQDQDSNVVVPITAMQQRLGGGKWVGEIKISARYRNDIPKLKDEIRAAIRVSHKLPPNKKDDVHIFDLGSMAESFDKVLITMTALLSSIAGISLLVGGIGIMNIMLVSVTERTREIGLRMAVGAIEFDILMQFLVEAVVLSLLGGMVGVLFGVSISAITSHSLEWPVLVSGWSIVLAVVFSGGVGIFFGIYPAWRASRLDPIVALRHE